MHISGRSRGRCLTMKSPELGISARAIKEHNLVTPQNPTSACLGSPLRSVTAARYANPTRWTRGWSGTIALKSFDLADAS